MLYITLSRVVKKKMGRWDPPNTKSAALSYNNDIDINSFW